MELDAQGKPWFLAVNLVNPHDIMFINTDRPGQPVQANNILGHIRPEPRDPLYTKEWAFDLPPTYPQQLDASGRPSAHVDYIRSHDALVGNIPNEDWNYYLNCLRDVDRNAAMARVRAMCEQLLANGVIEDFRIEIAEGA